VVRGGQQQLVTNTDILVGDLLVLDTGDKVGGVGNAARGQGGGQQQLVTNTDILVGDLLVLGTGNKVGSRAPAQSEWLREVHLCALQARRAWQ
jgi:hypothetical protein